MSLVHRKPTKPVPEVQEHEERLLPARPLLSPEQELKALDAEREVHKFEIAAGQYAWAAKEERRQYLMKKIAGPIRAPQQVPMDRMTPKPGTGFENSPMRAGK